MSGPADSAPTRCFRKTTALQVNPAPKAFRMAFNFPSQRRNRFRCRPARKRALRSSPMDVHDRSPGNPPDAGFGEIPPDHAPGIWEGVNRGAAKIGGGAGGAAGDTPADEFPAAVESVPTLKRDPWISGQTSSTGDGPLVDPCAGIGLRPPGPSMYEPTEAPRKPTDSTPAASSFGCFWQPRPLVKRRGAARRV